MKRAIITAITAVLVASAGSNASASATQCNSGFSWGAWTHAGVSAGTFGAAIRVRDYASAWGEHTIARLSFERLNGGLDEIQAGVWAEYGGRPRFYVEVSGPGVRNPGGWERRGPFLDHFWRAHGPRRGRSYAFRLTNLGDGYYKASGPGYTSRAIYLGSAGMGDTALTNETFSSRARCVAYGNYGFRSLTAEAATPGYFVWGVSGANPFFAGAWAPGELTANGW